jgi:predicted RecB family nuclease
MPLQTPGRARLLAHNLYDLAVCEHKVALDARLDRSLRTPPDEALALLLERGNRYEAEIAAALGWPEIEVERGDFEAAAARTLALMRDGAPGIYQGVLLEGARLARPDLLERRVGVSVFGDWTYAPGDVKSALAPRTDAVLQVGFAALLLARLVGAPVARGFLVLGDGTREELDLDALACSIEDAVERAEAIQDGREATAPFFSAACARCAWRGRCLPELQEARDASFADGLTRTLHRVLARHGVRTLDDLAAADVEALRRSGAPADGLDRLRRQARALVEGVPVGHRPVELPRGVRREHYLRIDTDPIDGGAPFLIAWAGGRANAGTPAPATLAIVATDAERAAAFVRLAADLEAESGADDPVYIWGRATSRAFDALGDAAAAPAARLGDLEGRLVDLSPWVRRAAALPVWRYRFDEVGAFVRGAPRPAPDEPEDALFVDFARLRAGNEPGPLRARLERAGRDGIVSLHAIRRWLA